MTSYLNEYISRGCRIAEPLPGPVQNARRQSSLQTSRGPKQVQLEDVGVPPRKKKPKAVILPRIEDGMIG